MRYDLEQYLPIDNECDDKKIIIKNPQLRNLRNSLREILVLAYYDEEIRLDALIKKLNHIGEYDDGKKPNDEELRESNQLTKNRFELKRAFESSIIFCKECYKSDNDMIFIEYPAYEWICVDCYKGEYKGYIEQTRENSYKNNL